MSEAVALQTRQNSVLIRMGERFGVDPNKLYTTLKATAFKGDVSNEQFLALMIVADQYKLNPLTKEIYAFPDKNNGIVPVVGVDGWSRILNEHPQFDGVEFADGPIKDGLPEWIECKIFRKDRQHPTVVREYMAECKRGTGPWGSHPRRLLRHKSLIQAARLAMGFVGIYDQDEAERIVEGTATLVPFEAAASTVAELNAEIAPKKAYVEKSQYGPQYAEVRAALDKAKDVDAVDAAESMVDSLPDQFHAELHELAKAKREALTK